MSDPRQEVIDALVAERYSKPLWWKTPTLQPVQAIEPDTDIACARRRRELLEAVELDREAQ